MKDIWIGGTRDDFGNAICCHKTKLECVHGGGRLFWCKEDITDTRIFLVEGCIEHSIIKELVHQENKEAETNAKKFLLQLMRKYAEDEDFIEFIEATKKASFDRGYNKCRKDIRNVLGL